MKKIPVDKLRPGMYIGDLNAGWMDHPFLTSQFEVKDQATIDRIVAAGIREVYIDTSRGLDVPWAPTRAEVNERLDRELRAAAETRPEVPTPVRFEEELSHAVVVKGEAQAFAHTLLGDVRLGRQIEVERVEPVVESMVDSVFRNTDALVSLCRIKDADEYTFLHCVSVCVLLIAFAKSLHLDPKLIRELAIGALLHDVGKMRIPDEVLNKPDRLTDEEFKIMKQHAALGEEILAQTPGISDIALQVAAQHHERFDGSGYPRGLRDKEISLYGQMAAIVDVYDAITSDRIYHKGMTPTTALRKIFEWSAFHFNKKLVHNFIHCVGIYPSGTLVRLHSGRLAVVMEQSGGSSLTPRVRVVYDTHKNRALPPYDLDLADAASAGTDKIVDQEPPERWQLNPQEILTSTLH